MAYARRALCGYQRLADLGERTQPLLGRALRVGLTLRRPVDCDLLAQLAERRLCLGAGQALGVLLGVDEAEAALDLVAAVAPLRDPGVAVGAGALDERPAAVAGAALTCAPLPFVLPPEAAIPLYHSLYHFGRKSAELGATQGNLKTRFLQRKCGKMTTFRRPPEPICGPGGRGFESPRSP